ncbi:MAG: phosphate signaling complex protein PhoU [Verrucomicrobia bacterium]|nr:phosphate signaling complex protein PhoU [Verrucomicrobiota bacterium]
MSLHLVRDLDALKQSLLEICALVEKSVVLAVRSLETRDAVLARQVIDEDDEIDSREVRMEEEALKLLALYQPVAVDLRWIVAAIKINSDLERIGDLAVNIAQRAERLTGTHPLRAYMDLELMADKALSMLRGSLDALFNMDTTLARKVCDSDDEVDALNRDNYDHVRQALQSGTEDFDFLIQALGVSRNLERVADHATNIAQDVIYMTEGRIVRHRDPSPGGTALDAGTA